MSLSTGVLHATDFLWRRAPAAIVVALTGSLLALASSGRALAQAPGTPASTLTRISAAVGRQGAAGVLLEFDGALPIYSVIGDGTRQPVVAFAGTKEARGLSPPADLKGAAKGLTMEPGEGVLSIHFKEVRATHLVASPEGDHGVLISIQGGAAPTASAGTNRPAVQLEPNEEGFEVVPLKYADVSEIVGLLTREQGVRPNDDFTPEPPAFGSAALGPASAPPPGAVGAVMQGADSAPQMVGQSIDPTIGIDRRLNAVILRGPPDVIAALKEKVAKLDRPITSVLLETVFVELTETGAKNVGLDLANSSGQLASATYNIGPTPTGGAGLKSFGTASLQAAIYDQVQKGRGKIISKPRISAQSGSSAKIVTGDAVPILTSIALSGVNAVSQQVQYVTVGVTLQIAPRVSDDGFVTSHVFCEVSSVTGSSQGYPTISQREATTSATVRDGESFVIGGLTQDETQSTKSKTPGLSAIPGLGKLFDLEQSSRSKTDLYIVVTPHIVRAGDTPPLPPVLRPALGRGD